MYSNLVWLILLLKTNYAKKKFGKDISNLNGEPDPFDDDEEVRAAIELNLAAVRSSDITLAFLPQASMGTAVEMMAAYEAKKTVYSITPLKGLPPPFICFSSPVLLMN